MICQSPDGMIAHSTRETLNIGCFVSEFTPQIHLDGVFTPFGIIKVASSTITIRQDTKGLVRLTTFRYNKII